MRLAASLVCEGLPWALQGFPFAAIKLADWLCRLLTGHILVAFFYEATVFDNSLAAIHLAD